MLYLVQVKYQVSDYMDNGYESYEEYRLVDAEDEIQAEIKVENHYKEKTSEYSIYYQVNDINITSVII